MRQSEEIGFVFCFADIQLNDLTKQVNRGVRRVRLGPTEYKLLKLFLSRVGIAVSREEIVMEIYGDSSAVDIRTVDVQIGRLRRALNRGRDVDPIKSVRGVGYVFGRR